jgi:hypothetical protein
MLAAQFCLVFAATNIQMTFPLYLGEKERRFDTVFPVVGYDNTCGLHGRIVQLQGRITPLLKHYGGTAPKSFQNRCPFSLLFDY